MPTADRRDPLMAQADLVMAKEEAKIQARMDTLDRRSAVDTILENVDRQASGKPLINPRDLREQTDAVMNDPNLKDKEKKEKVDQLRKDNGLSEYTMRNMATQPLTHIYTAAAQETGSFYGANRATLEENVRRAETRYGKDSPPAAAALAEVGKLDGKLGAYANHLQSVGNTLGGMYPPPKPSSFWDSFGSFFVSLFKAVGPALLNLIPGVGTALSVGAYAIEGIVDAAQGNYLGMVTDFVGAVPGLGEAAGLAGEALTTGADVAKAGIGLGSGIASGDPLKALGGLGGLAGGLGDLSDIAGLGGVADVTGTIGRGIGVVKGGVQFVTALGNGDLTGALGRFSDTFSGATGFSLGDMAGEFLDGPLGEAGRWAKSTFGDTLGALGGADWVGTTADWARQGTTFVDNLRNGSFSAALGGLTGALGGMDVPELRRFAALLGLDAQFLNDMTGGGLTRVFNGFSKDLSGFLNDPTFAQIGTFFGQARQLFGAMANGQYSAALGAFAQDLEGDPGGAEIAAAKAFARQATSLLQNAAGGDLRKAFEKLADMAGTLADSPILNRAIAAAGRGMGFVESLLSGDLRVRLNDLIQQHGSASPLGQAAQRVMIQAASAERFIRGLTGESFAAGVGRLPELLPQAGALREAAATLAGGANFFRGLASGELLGGVLAYREQLQTLSKALRSFDLLEGFEHHAASMLERRDLSRMLIMDFARVQQERSETGADLAGVVQARRVR